MQNYCQNDPQNDPNRMMSMLMNMLSGMDNKLQSIEGQLNHQSQRWKSIENQIANQNKRMDSIEKQIVQINSIKQAVSNTQSEVFKLSTDMSTMKTKIDDYDNSIQKYSDMCDDIVSSYTERESELDHVMDKLITIQIQQNQMQEKQSKMEEKLIEVQWRGMRENLIFTGIAEKNLPYGEFENVELTLKNFLRDEMNITQDIQFDRVHRVGKFDRNHSFPRPIIAKFEKFKDKELVRLSASKTLVGKHYGVNEQFPTEIESKRKQLYPIAKQARRNKNNKVKLVRDRLYINGEEISVKNCTYGEAENGGQSHTERTAQRTNNKPSYSGAVQGSMKMTDNRLGYQKSQGRGQGQNRGFQFQGQGQSPRGHGIRSRGQSYRTRGQGQWATPRYEHSNARPLPREIPDFSIQTQNSFSALSDLPQDKHSNITYDKKKKATSPLDRDVIIKKCRDDSICCEQSDSEYEEQSKTISSVSKNGYADDTVHVDMECQSSIITITNSVNDSGSVQPNTTLGSTPNTQQIRLPRSVDSSMLYHGPSVLTEQPEKVASDTHVSHEKIPQSAPSDNTDKALGD